MRANRLIVLFSLLDRAGARADRQIVGQRNTGLRLGKTVHEPHLVRTVLDEFAFHRLKSVGHTNGDRFQRGPRTGAQKAFDRLMETRRFLDEQTFAVDCAKVATHRV